MKTSLASALQNPDGNGASQISLSSSYQVPATDGRLVLATPLKFCLNFRPPTIAVVYTLEKSKKSSKSGKQRKYIHEIRVDFEGCMDKKRVSSLSSLEPKKPLLREVETLCRELCDAEATYLNINVISKTQVLNLITKLYEKKYGCQPPNSPKAVAGGAAPGAPTNLLSAKPKDDDQISDTYDDDFDESEKKKKESTAGGKKEAQDAAEEDEWGLEDDDWGDLDDVDSKNKKQPDYSNNAAASNKNSHQTDEQKRQNLFFGGNKDDVTDLDDLPEIGSNFQNKNEDKFNQVMSSSKEGGGLLASIGLKKDDVNQNESLDESQEEDPHKKSDLFDNSKDKIGAGKAARQKNGAQQSDEEDFDLGFGSNKKGKEHEKTAVNINKSGADEFEQELAGMSDDDGPMTDEQQKAIHEQFQMIYEKDPELRKALEKSDVASFNIEEKYSIIEAYMQGGAAGLQIELEDDEEDEKAVLDMSEEEIAVVEAQFAKLYAADPELQSAIGQASSLTLLQKYQILVQYQRAGENSGMVGNTSNDAYFSGDEMTEIIEHEGKKYRRVQIEGQDGDHLMDEEANIYTLDFEKIGKAGDSDDDEEI